MLRQLAQVFEHGSYSCIGHGVRRESARLFRFCGATRIIPQRGLSISEMKKKATAIMNGRIMVNHRLFQSDPYPTSPQQHKDIATISIHAPRGIRFHHAACE